jgi:hypothetical protein
MPGIASRNVPPPIPVTQPSRMKPKISMRLREASAPVAANTAVPIQSNAVRNVPSIVLPQRHQPPRGDNAMKISYPRC